MIGVNIKAPGASGFGAQVFSANTGAETRGIRRV